MAKTTEKHLKDLQTLKELLIKNFLKLLKDNTDTPENIPSSTYSVILKLVENVDFNNEEKDLLAEQILNSEDFTSSDIETIKNNFKIN